MGVKFVEWLLGISPFCTLSYESCPQPCKVSVMILQMGKPRLREVRSLAQIRPIGSPIYFHSAPVPPSQITALQRLRVAVAAHSVAGTREAIGVSIPTRSLRSTSMQQASSLTLRSLGCSLRGHPQGIFCWPLLGGINSDKAGGELNPGNRWR